METAQRRRWRIVAVREKQMFLGSIAGRWVVELEGWDGDAPDVGEFLFDYENAAAHETLPPKP